MQLAIVTDVKYRAQVIEQILVEHGWQVVACVGQGQPYAWLMQQPVLDIILIDLNIVDAIGLFQELAAAQPHLPLIALATPQRIAELQGAMLAGATNFIAFPPEPKQLLATLARARHDAAAHFQAMPAHTLAPLPIDLAGGSQRRSKVIVITSLKGGVGRSTIAVNLAIGLRQQTNRSVVLVEAHHGLGNLALLLNLYPRHTTQSLEDEPNVDLDLLQGLLQPHSSGVRLLAAPTDPAQVVELPAAVWQQTIDLLREGADYVVVDTAAHADDVLSTLVALADEILVVIGVDIAGLRDGRILLQSLRHEANVTGNIQVVLNRAGAQGGIDERIVQAQLEEPVAGSLPEDVGLATFAFNRGIPFMVSHPRALLSRRLGGLVERLIPDSVNPVVELGAHRSSLFSFLRFA